MEKFFLLDPDGAVILTSPSFDSLLGFEAGELKGKDASAFLYRSPEERKRIREEILLRLQTQGSWAGPLNVRKKDGTPFCRLYSNQPLLDLRKILLDDGSPGNERRRAAPGPSA